MNSNSAFSDPGLSSSKSWDLPAILVTVFITATFVMLGTRLRTSLDFSTSEEGKERRPPVLPYSIPYVGHILGLLYNPDHYLDNARRSSPTSIFALNLRGRRHNVICSPFMIDNILKLSDSEVLNKQPIDNRLFKNVFLMPSRELLPYMDLQCKLQTLYAKHLQDFNSSDGAIHRAVRCIQVHLPELLTLNPALIDQEPWERSSNTKLDSNNDTAEISLLPLIHIFLTHITIKSLLSPSLIDQKPEIAPLLLDLSRNFIPLLTGLPRTIPHPSLPKAHISRRNLLNHLEPFCVALRAATANQDPGPEYRDLLEDEDAVTPLLSEMQNILAVGNGQGKSLSLDARIAALAALLWHMNGSHALAFWMILHIVASPDAGLVERLREEVESFVRATEPEKVMGFAQPVSMDIDVEGLTAKCPILRSCFLETVRVYGRGWMAGKIMRDFTLVEDDNLSWSLKRNEWVHVPFWVGNKADGLFHPDPEMWRYERHIDYVKMVSGGETAMEGKVYSEGKADLLFPQRIKR